MAASRNWLLLLLSLFLASCGNSEQAETGVSTTTLAVPTVTEQVILPTPETETTTIAPSPSVSPTPTHLASSPTSAAPANADVTFVRAVEEDGDSWTFHVTVAHPDTGWEDYADGWDVVTPSGTVLKRDEDDAFTRVLLHPHVGEQPFTRSQSGLVLPEGVEEVTIRAHDLVAGFGGKTVTVDLTAASGPDFEVERREE